MYNFLEQAQVAADRKNWPLLVECLQQVTAKGGKSQEQHILQQAVSLAIEALEWGDFQDRWEIAKVLPNLGNGAIAPLISILEDEDADTEAAVVRRPHPRKVRSPGSDSSFSRIGQKFRRRIKPNRCRNPREFRPLAIESLATLLLQEDSRQFATAALAQIRRSETIAPLLSVVGDSQVAVRAHAIEALSSFHDSRIPPVLVAALKDPATAVRKEAVRSLGVRAYLDAELDLVKLLKPLLSDIRLEVCKLAAIAIGRVKTDAAAAALFELLRSPLTPVELQIETVRALSWSETAAALEYLQQTLIAEFYNTNYPVCQEIVTVLGRVEKPELKAKAAEITIDLLKTGHPAVESVEIKQSLALGLGQLGDMRALDVLIQMLADADTSVRLHCMAALKQLGAAEARRQLESLVKQDSLEPKFKQGIAIALQEW